MDNGAAGRDDSLTKYRTKRDFNRTAEPTGQGGATSEGHRFVVQRHRARRLHYDLRLEMDGVLASWAVPKGPTLDPDVRRMAVRVEDHPLEYADFEGVIPEGEYGGGDVIVWDRGTWQSAETDDPANAVETGNLHFDLYGEKLAGRFVLTRRRGADPKNWLLLHKHDEHAKADWDPEDHPLSVKSGRTNDDVAAAPDALWRGDLPASEAERPVNQDSSTPRRRRPRVTGQAQKARQNRPEYHAPTEDELAALDELGTKGTWHMDGRKLALTNLDKILFPASNGELPITKRDLIRYHATIAPTMLPYLSGRPLNTHRFPDGVDKPGFWQKEVPSPAPGWLRRWHYPHAGVDETRYYLVPDSVASLAWLANYGALELHAWTSRIPDVDHPTWVLFDIDPGPKTTFDQVLTLARLHRTALEHLGLDGRPKVTGQRGIQVWVPIEPRYTFAQTREWAETVSKTIGRVLPDLVSWAWHTSDRKSLARLDYTQNVVNKTLVAPYSARPRPGAPVSVPLEWEELDDPELRPDCWTIQTVLDRLATVGDPFSALLGNEQRLPGL
jgi:bifunctional non-homologous end joining protein LigD